MPLELLRSLFERGFPATVTDPSELDAVRLLESADCLKVEFGETPRGQPCAIVTRLTDIGRTIVKGARGPSDK